MVAGLQRAEFSDPLATQDDEDELDLSLGLSIGGGNKRKAEIDFLSGSFPVARSVTRNPNSNPIPAMPLYMPPPCRIFPSPGVLVNPNPSSNLNLNVTPNPNHGENDGKRSVRMKRTPSYSGSPISSSSGPIRGRSSGSSSETRSHSDPHVTDKKPNKQSIQEVISKPTTQAAAAAEKVDHMPCVMTMGRNGTTVNGVLYRYNEREVSIVCVCHGTPFSPEGFVRHAGGTESSNPLRQIVVVPS